MSAATKEPIWRATVLTLFPAMFPGPLGLSLAGKALAEGIWALETVDIRDSASDKHRSVDDAPFGGGPGMVMRPDVVDRALKLAHWGPEPAVYLSPRGRRLDQRMVQGFAARRSLSVTKSWNSSNEATSRRRSSLPSSGQSERPITVKRARS